MSGLQFQKSVADPCLYFKWDDKDGLIVRLSWIDDLLVINKSKECVLREVERVKEVFGVDDVGSFEDYLGCKLDFNWKKPSCRLTQPVLVKSMQDMHGAASARRVPLPATAGTTLSRVIEGDKDVASGDEQTYYQGLVGQLLHLSSWSRPDISNAVREVSRHGHQCARRHINAAKKIAAYVWQTPNRGWILEPKRRWNGRDKSFKFKIYEKECYWFCRLFGRVAGSYKICHAKNHSFISYRGRAYCSGSVCTGDVFL